MGEGRSFYIRDLPTGRSWFVFLISVVLFFLAIPFLSLLRDEHSNAGWWLHLGVAATLAPGALVFGFFEWCCDHASVLCHATRQELRFVVPWLGQKTFSAEQLKGAGIAAPSAPTAVARWFFIVSSILFVSIFFLATIENPPFLIF